MKPRWTDPTIDYNGVNVTLPNHDSIMRYLTHGMPPGDFLTGVLANDLRRACGHADSFNQPLIPWYSAWLYNYMPSLAHGSYERMSNWYKARAFVMEHEPIGPFTDEQRVSMFIARAYQVEYEEVEDE